MAKDTFFKQTQTINVGGKLLDLTSPKIMGIVNLTPDSFYTNSRFNTETEVLNQAQKMLTQGAHILDLGAYSTRPGASEVLEKEEAKRLLPAIKAIKNKFPDTVISVDTFRANIARLAVEAGADMINDVSGGEFDSQMFTTIAKLQVPYILMHNRGTPKTMHLLNNYANLMGEVILYFSTKINQLRALGVHDIVLDPGFGFAKNSIQNFELLSHLNELEVFELPFLAGLSRKSMIWKSLNIKPEDALNGTSILNTIALQKGAKILRVHDVAETVECVKLVSLVGA